MASVRDIFEITYVNSKIGPLKSNLDGNQDIELFDGTVDVLNGTVL